MTDYVGEQEMELEALEAILMDDMKEVDGSVRDRQIVPVCELSLWRHW